MSKPLAVLISDIHYNINTLALADAALMQANALSIELGVPLIVAGDLHDTKALVRGECIIAMMNTLRVGPNRRIVIPGNHCMLNSKGKGHSLEFLRDRCEIVDIPSFDKELGLYLLPYFNDSEELKEVLREIPEKSTIVCHQGLLGADMGSYVQDKTSLPPECFSNFRVISGHYHKRQDIKCGPPRKGAVGLFSYIGNPYTLSFGESKDPEKGFQILHENGILTHVPTNLRKHIIIELDASTALSSIFGGVSMEDLLWLKIRGPKSEINKIKKESIGYLLPHNNFKLDLISTDEVIKPVIQDKATEYQLLDSLIDHTPETAVQKDYLKFLWRNMINA